MSDVTLYEGDCLDVLPTLEAGSIDSIVCDPPYGLSFMGKDWDYGVPGVPFWEAALRVAKPGAMLLAFGGTRTHHRLTCAIEDAGWEIRDCLMWLYGQGFPKSLDIGKAIDKAAGAEREVIGTARAGIRRNGRKDSEGGIFVGGLPEELKHISVTAPATDAARQWDGWGTALKPAWEPIIMAMKPLDGTFANNALVHGVAGINVDATRIGTDDHLVAGGCLRTNSGDTRNGKALGMFRDGTPNTFEQHPQGRWPANLIIGDDETAAMLDEASGPNMHTAGIARNAIRQADATGMFNLAGDGQRYGDTGGASRFFYCAKASKRDRDEGLEGMELRPSYMVENGSKTSGLNGERYDRQTMARNHHPTVKPTSLMRWLVRLVTPPGGVVLDQFCGSGSTGKAAVLEGFNFIGIEKEAEYLEIAKRRIEAAQLPFPYGTSLEVA